MSSFFDTKVKTNNKKQMAEVKRTFRNSFDEQFSTIQLSNYDYDSKWTDANLFIETQNEDERDNDDVGIRAMLLDSTNTFTLSITTSNEYYGKKVKFTLFMDNEIRKEIIEKLSDVIIN